MSRFIMISLLLVVFFFGGVSYGTFEKNKLPQQQETESIEETVSIDTSIIEIEREPVQQKEEGDKLVHKTASFFERIVKKMYELIIHALYGIANLFFD
ncbi:MAG TPA: hypothetical protein VK085_08340 [Pseudogracilibacillus sp.]|nr:hypothetical protein [Pseudogracilibacillus sp.]